MVSPSLSSLHLLLPLSQQLDCLCFSVLTAEHICLALAFCHLQVKGSRGCLASQISKFLEERIWLSQLESDYHSQFGHLFIQKVFIECQEALGDASSLHGPCVFGGAKKREWESMSEKAWAHFSGDWLESCNFQRKTSMAWDSNRPGFKSRFLSQFLSCVTLGISDAFFIPNFLPSKIGITLSKVVRRIKMKGQRHQLFSQKWNK